MKSETLKIIRRYAPLFQKRLLQRDWLEALCTILENLFHLHFKVSFILLAIIVFLKIRLLYLLIAYK